MSDSTKTVPSKRPAKKPKVPRTDMPCQPAEERATNFEEVTTGYDDAMATLEASRCMMCKKPKCVAGCPMGNDIPGFVKLIQDGDLPGAIAKLKETTSFPGICARVCPQENQCETLCILGNKSEPLAIGRLERYAADWELAQGASSKPEIAPKNGKHVGVVGSGPVGLSCAAELAKLGYGVTVYEAMNKPGGMLLYGIPEFRLPKAVVAGECEYVESLGVEIKTDYVVEDTATVDQMLAGDHDAIFLANGAGLPSFMNIPGENLSGVSSADEFLTRSNLMQAYGFAEYESPIKSGMKVAVIGGGNVALDAARTALRLGAEVHLVYRRSIEEMPARREEIAHAQEEGIVFDLLAKPTQLIGDDNGSVKEIEVIDLELGEPDASGHQRPLPVDGSERRIPVDVVLVAVAGENTLATSKEGVFSAGDIVTGADSVTVAMGAGKTGALTIDRYLQGESLPEGEQQSANGKVPAAVVPVDLGYVALDKNACVTCGVCAHVCGADAIELRPAESSCAWIYDPAACTFCGDCVTECPVDALTQAVERGAVREETESFNVDYVACGGCGELTMPFSDLLTTKAFPQAAVEQRDRARVCEKCREQATAQLMKDAFERSCGAQA